MAIVRIDIPKGVQDGQTSVSSQSPRSNVAQSQPMSTGGKIALGYGALAARTSYQTVSQEIRASGNEELATQMENIVSIATNATLLYATGGVAGIPMVVQEIASTVSRVRQASRQNRNKEFQTSQMGNRVTFNQGRAYE